MNAQTIGETPERIRGNGNLHEQIDRHRQNIDQTLSELESRLSPGELLDSSLHYVKDGPADFLRNLGGAARGNPMPLALIGVGLGWLMLGSRDDGDGIASRASHAARDAAHKAADKAKGAAHGAAQRFRSDDDAEEPYEPEAVSGYTGTPDLGHVYAFCLREAYPFEDSEVECILFEDLGPQALNAYQADLRRRRGLESEIGGHTMSGGPHLSDEARSRIDSTRARMAEGSSRVKERVARARSSAWRRAHRATEELSRKAHEVGEHGGELVDRYPLSLIALGLAAGAALGTTLPGTRHEDQLMGDASDDVKHKARATLREKGERAKQAARDAAHAAADEARAQGLDPEHIKEEGRRLGEDVTHAAGTAQEDFRERRSGSTSAKDMPRKAREKAERIAEAARDAATGRNRPPEA